MDATVPYGPFRGYTPLHFAANTEIAEYLLANGADVKATVTDGFFKGVTPLHRAAYKGYTEVAELLLANGAEATAKNQWGQTPLFLANNNAIKAILQRAKEAE